jgi:type I restriction enzyme S subunit
MKNSGVDWIGDIPSHWDVKRFCNIFKFSKGLGITKEDLMEEGVPCVSYGEVHSKYGFEVRPSKDLLKCVDVDYLKTSPKSLLENGDFVFADTSEDLDGAGNFTYLNGESKIFAGYHTIIARPSKEIFPRYLAYLFSSQAHRNQIREKVKGVKVYSITKSILKDIKVILPTPEEQEAIVKDLDSKVIILEETMRQQAFQIEKLKEYKASLINSAVTGKIKVI